MIVAAHQPNFLPWAGYFYKYLMCDTWVDLVGVQIERRGYVTRTGFGNEARTLTVPSRGSSRDAIHDTQVLPGDRKYRKLVATLEHGVAHAPYRHRADSVLDYLHSISNPMPVSKFNLDLIGLMIEEADIPRKEFRAIDTTSKKATETTHEWLHRVIKSAGGTGYLSGEGAKEYLPEDFPMPVWYQKTYRQVYTGSYLWVMVYHHDPLGYLFDNFQIE